MLVGDGLKVRLENLRVWSKCVPRIRGREVPPPEDQVKGKADEGDTHEQEGRVATLYEAMRL